MSQDDRKAWIAAAAAALRDIPLDQLRAGVDAAMRVADHPARIVPAVVREVDRLRALGANLADYPPRPGPPPLAVSDDAPTEITAEEIRAMPPHIRRMGLNAGFITTTQVLAAVGREGGQTTRKEKP